MYNDVNHNSFQIFYGNNETVITDDENNTQGQMNNQSNCNQEGENNFQRSNQRRVTNREYYNRDMIN